MNWWMIPEMSELLMGAIIGIWIGMTFRDEIADAGDAMIDMAVRFVRKVIP